MVDLLEKAQKYREDLLLKSTESEKKPDLLEKATKAKEKLDILVEKLTVVETIEKNSMTSMHEKEGGDLLLFFTFYAKQMLSYHSMHLRIYGVYTSNDCQ